MSNGGGQSSPLALGGGGGSGNGNAYAQPWLQNQQNAPAQQLQAQPQLQQATTLGGMLGQMPDMNAWRQSHPDQVNSDGSPKMQTEGQGQGLMPRFNGPPFGKPPGQDGGKCCDDHNNGGPMQGTNTPSTLANPQFSFASGGPVKQAKGLASLGRNGDRMLVHMSPQEVAALQSIAHQNGTTLTRNPETGLIEAGSLQSLLPMLAGAVAAGAVTYFSGGSMAGLSPSIYGAIAGGATNAATDKSNASPLMKFGAGALGGYGGAGLGSAVAGVGAGAGAAGAAPAATTTAAAAPSTTGAVYPGLVQEGAQSATNVAANQAKTQLAQQAANGAAKYSMAGHTFGQNMANMGHGLGSLAQNPSTAMERLGAQGASRYQVMGALAPGMVSSANPDTSGMPKDKTRYWLTGFDPSGGQYTDGHWADKYPGYAGGGEVDPSMILPDNSGMATMTPQETAQYVQSFNAGAQTPAYMRNPNSFYNPNRAPMPTPVPAPGSPSTTIPQPVMGGTSSTLPAGTPKGTPTGFDPSTGKYTGSTTTDGTTVPYKNTSSWAKLAALDSPSHKWILNKLGFHLAGGGPVQTGIAAGYAPGGMLHGPGDGMSDSIPATINGQQQARLADGEFVVPADVVSHLGNGSTKAGADRLYSMMDRVRKARTGSASQGKQINADKFLP